MAKEAPNRVAITVIGSQARRELTYRDWEQAAVDLSQHLVHDGISQGDLVALALDHSEWDRWAVAQLASSGAEQRRS
jgi:acyl-coenzyme A synthetase/AMP-(fatty) acid ligase